MPTTLNDPIDGAELKEIILKRIGDQLDKDCTLGNDIAYAGFHLNFEIKLKYLRSKVEETLVWGNMKEGGDHSDTDTPHDVGDIILADTYLTDSPNTAREDHDLPIPVIVQTPNGMERRKVKLGRPPKVKDQG